ncbi:phosphonate C-P lyase system protein PhnH [Roseomonas sp. M0104]|uniref:Phosphonate C-P lyase system protein PhnH n=1 Tax=Teichococcus coralli TaxID=2545983 RepID=A0A845BB75_9PROT|nr:phosphonate C-P lyase system protein PhnH [Pseudoroseomonas coralli]MXP63400.1 phosphonate C-P lyase system protein PhnH [Pseudoroseomonas coralli]
MMRPGFTDPVLDAQSCFRAVLEAMSRPGRVQRLAAPLQPPAPLAPATAAVLLTLVDAETPLWLDAGDEAAEWVRFHCGCPIATTPAEAAFVLATGTPPDIAALPQGTDEAPEAGATLVWQAAALEAGQGWRLSGPGIEHEHRLRVGGAPEGFRAAWAAQRGRYPRGVDIILCAGEAIAALPRTTRIEEG